MRTVAQLSAALASGAMTSEALTAEALARIADPAGEGGRAFVRVYRESALDEARSSDRLRRHGIVPSPLAGLPVSVKDLFDVAGDVTRAGSKVLADQSPAARDAAAIARLRAAGAVIVGRTNMTEFAYSGLGLNPHFGTPASPFDRARRRIPGGSSSGAAVSVTDGMAVMGLGTDTGGSVRIPAAFCGLAGFKPTARRVPTRGAFPLSATLDSIGPIAPSVACCAAFDSVLSGDEAPLPLPLAGLRLGVVRNYLVDGLDAGVARAFEHALRRFGDEGARLSDVRVGAVDRIVAAGVQGIVAAAEAWAIHRKLLARREHEYDPRVAVRIRRGESVSAGDYIDALTARAAIVAGWEREVEPFDALLAPAVMCEAPTIATLERDDEAYARSNLAALRNTSVVNALDGCALSLPCQAAGETPVGLMVFAPAGRDRRVLQVGRAAEHVLAI